MAPTTAGWRKALQWLGLASGLAALVWFLATLDWPGLGRVIARVHWGWLALAAVLMLADYAVHAWRWRVLLRHVVPRLELHTVWRASTILWAFNTMLPL